MKERLSEYTVHEHPRSGDRVPGRRLQPGETIHEGDVYDASSGKWEKVPCPGLVLEEGATAYFVRSSTLDQFLDAEEIAGSPDE